MSNVDIKTQNLEFDGSKLRIFDKEGFNSGNNWVVNAMIGCFVEVDPSPISNEIIELINADMNAGNFDKIHHVSLKPINLLSLYLEGGIPVESIVKANDAGDKVVFNNVSFNTNNGMASVSIWVSKDSQMATIDKNGEVV